MTILLTGANGFVGRNLLRCLAKDSSLRFIATDLQEHLVLPDEEYAVGITYLNGDLSSKEFNTTLRKHFRFDCIIHLAAILSQAEDMSTYFSVMDSNTYTTFLLLETAREHNAQFIFPSTALVYGDAEPPFTEEMNPNPEVFYALSKHMGEQLIRFYHNKYGLSHVIFRIGILYGPGQHDVMFIPSIITKLLKGEDFPMTEGEQVRDFVYIDDFLDIVRIALSRREISGIFNVGTGHAPTMKETAFAVEKLIGVTGKIKPGALPYREKEVWRYCLDITKTRRTFGWTPGTSLTDGLLKTVAYYKTLLGK